MKKCINGDIIEMSAEETTAMQAEQAALEAQERRRPLTETEVAALLIRQQINTIDVDDQTALRMLSYYPEWENLIGRTVDKSGFRFSYGAKLYKTIPASHTFAAQWVPGVGTESLYARIDEEHAGTLEDPIPYDGGMELTEGLYYVQDSVVYLCTRGTGQPVYNALSDLAGIYVETVA